jgi:hypothetical protein
LAAFDQEVVVQPTPEMPATATRATQWEHEGPWLFWAESSSEPIAKWTDFQMRAALRIIAAIKKGRTGKWCAVVKGRGIPANEGGGHEEVPWLLNSDTQEAAWLEARSRFGDNLIRCYST